MPTSFAAIGAGGEQEGSSESLTRPGIDQLIRSERLTGAPVRDLDRQLQSLSDQILIHGGFENRSEFDRFVKAETALKDRDNEINQELKTLYEIAVDSKAADRLPALVRLSMLHWATLIRRRTMQNYHTSVPGLVEDPDCRGDLVTDHMLLDYFEALFDSRSANVRAAAAASALAALARQTACLGEAQSANLASDLYWTFVEVAEFLRLNGAAEAVPYIVQSAFQPMLLFYDVEKYRGPQGPLARWFSEYADALVEGASVRRLPSYWHGLWLYDRRTGHVLGFRPSQAPLTENDVSLEMFVKSILSRQNLGRMDCSFVEMLERGPSRLGYLCAGSECRGEVLDRNPLTPGRYWWQILRPNRTGLDRDLEQNVVCGQPAGGDGPGGGSKSDKCNRGLKQGGRDRISASVACITERIVSPASRQLNCVAEAMGICADPIDKATKQLQSGLFQGIKLGRFCQHAEGPPPFPGPKTPEEQRKIELEYLERNVRFALEDVKRARIEDEAAHKAEDRALQRYRDNPNPTTRDEYNRASIRAQTKDNELRESEQRLKDRSDELIKKYPDMKQGTDPNPPKVVSKCPPDTPECGENACSAMAAQAMATLKCFEDSNNVLNRPEVMRPWGNNPAVVDPSPLSDPGAPAWANCLQSMTAVDPVSRVCWAVDCGNQSETVLSASGQCGCQKVGTSGGRSPVLQSPCGNLDCPEGTSPSVTGVGCRCEPMFGFDPVGSGGPIPKGKFTITRAPIFREPRVQEMPDVLWPTRRF